MASVKMEFAGYEFGVEDKKGTVTEYPTYDLAVEGARFRRDELGEPAKVRFRARYFTPWTPANEPPNREG